MSHVALTKCYFCGGPGDILFDGKLRDISKFHNQIINRNPCPQCKELMDKGILLIVVKENSTPSDEEEPFRTGIQVVVNRKKMYEIIDPEHPMFKCGWSYIDEPTAKHIGILNPDGSVIASSTKKNSQTGTNSQTEPKNQEPESL